MKKFVTTFSIFLFLLFSINTINAFAAPIHLSQGLYTLKDSHLVTGINYSVQNNSSGKSVLLVVDSNQMTQQLMRLEPNSPKYTIKPLNYGDIIIIIGATNLEFS